MLPYNNITPARATGVLRAPRVYGRQVARTWSAAGWVVTCRGVPSLRRAATVCGACRHTSLTHARWLLTTPLLSPAPTQHIHNFVPERKGRLICRRLRLRLAPYVAGDKNVTLLSDTRTAR